MRYIRLLEKKAARPRPSKCEACGGEQERGLHFDHDHGCCVKGCVGCFRGWLCFNCNAALGHVRDNAAILAKLIAYLGRKSTVYA